MSENGYFAVVATTSENYIPANAITYEYALLTPARHAQLFFGFPEIYVNGFKKLRSLKKLAYYCTKNSQ